MVAILSGEGGGGGGYCFGVEQATCHCLNKQWFNSLTDICATWRLRDLLEIIFWLQSRVNYGVRFIDALKNVK